MVTIDQVRRIAMSLPRTTEHVVRGRLKLRVGKIVYLAFSRDEKTMGFAFPKEWRAALIEAQPDTFHMPEPADEASPPPTSTQADAASAGDSSVTAR